MYSSEKIEKAGVMLAEHGMLPELKQIWHACFHDEASEIENFFVHFGDRVEVPVYVEEGRAVSMLCLLPAVRMTQEGESPVSYLYAVGTLPEFRGRGYCAKVLAYTLSLLAERGEGAVLVPAGEGLKGFYERQGFRVCLEGDTQLISGEQEAGREAEEAVTEVSETAAVEYTKLRDKAFAGPGYIRWDSHTVTYAVSLCLAEGGQCLKLRRKGREYGILFRLQEDSAYIYEVTAKEAGEAESVAKAFLRSRGLKKGILCRSACTMGAGLPKEPALCGYFNLILA